jgi:hypothetical protein
VGVLLANIAPGVPPTEADGEVAAVVHLSKNRPWRAITMHDFEPGLAERQTLYAIAERHQTLIQVDSDAVPPHPWELLVLQDVDGTGAEPTGHAGTSRLGRRPPMGGLALTSASAETSGCHPCSINLRDS